MTMHDSVDPGKYRILSRLLICLLALLSGCSGGGDADCSTVAQNRFVHFDLLDRYLWYDQVPKEIDYASFASPGQILDALRYATLDRFSYITSRNAFDNLFNNGTYIGYGFAFHIEGNGSVFLQFVYSQSPAGIAGLERGDEILQIDGQNVAAISAADGWDDVFGPAQPGLPVDLQLRRKSGAVEMLQLIKATVTINTVLHSAIFPGAANTIGYLVYSSFLHTSFTELVPVFDQFRSAGVDRLILDLRYNGGGSVSVARDLASYIKATTQANQDLYAELRFNDKYQSNNLAYYFTPQANSLGLNEVVVITTDATCSASEQVVTALRPFINVTTIGSASCGKPVGQIPRDFCASTLVAVNFASFNAADQGDYYSGIPADCGANDDAGFAFGDPAEPMLQAARYFVDNQTCPAVPRPRALRSMPMQGLREVAGAV